MNSRFFWMLCSVLAIVGAGNKCAFLQLPQAHIALHFRLTGNGMSKIALLRRRCRSFTHRAPVPGLTHSAVPAFPDVDQYQSRQLLSNLVQQGRYSKADYDKLGNIRGISHQRATTSGIAKLLSAGAERWRC